MEESRRQSPTGWYAAIVALLLLPVLYFVSFIPACWIAGRLDYLAHERGLRVFATIYGPAVDGLMISPPLVRRGAAATIDLGMPRGTRAWIDADSVGWNAPGYSYTVRSRSR